MGFPMNSYLPQHAAPDAAAESSARPVRVAVVGCGRWGRNLVRNFAELGALAALVDPDGGTIEAQPAAHQPLARSLEAVLADSAIDAVAVAAPSTFHYDLSRRALEAGKHVLVEKPLALRLDQAEALSRLAERLDRRLMVGHLMQYHPAFVALREHVRDGRLGTVQYLYSHRLNFGAIRQEEDALWSLAPHDASMILSLVGAEPDSVSAAGASYLHPSIADATTTHLGFPGGERAHIFVSWLHPFKEHRLVVVGSAGMAVLDDAQPWDRKLVLYPHRVAWSGGNPSPVAAAAAPVPLPAAEPLKLECQHFLDCVRTGARPRTDGHEGLRVLRVLARASESLAASRGSEAGSGAAVPAARVAQHHPAVTIHESAYVDARVQIGEGTRIWHFSHVLSDVTLGRHVNIGQNVVIGPRVTIGNNVKIQNNVSIYEGVTLEDGVFCGPSCVFTNVSNPRAEIERKSEFRPTRVRRGATIGANATILCGHTLGEYCFIAAGAVVTADVPAFALWSGVPGRRTGWVSHAGHRLGPDLVCPQTGRRYREIGEGLQEALEPGREMPASR
ncbi:MAG: Gfo/Idh/MocA family oxidoreductase [Dongiaceae bacterium]